MIGGIPCREQQQQIFSSNQKNSNKLPEAIRWYVEGLMERGNLECLTNIHRHSGSKTATIQLTRNAENITVTIQDAGRGIPPEKLDGIQAQRSGVGIAGMRERIRHFSGVMNIQSDGSGTRIAVMLPIRAVSQPEQENILQEQPSAVAG
jgi:two-component system, NarL family, sensor kinase